MNIVEIVADRIEGSPAIISCRRMRAGYANANYRLETSAGLFLVRHCIHQGRSEVEFELNVLDWLRASGFPAPVAFRFTGGDRWIEGPDGSHVVLLEWLHGSEPLPNLTNVAVVARALGELHCLPPPWERWWHRENPGGLKAASRLKATVGPGAPELFRVFASELEQLQDHLCEDLPRGFIHGDLFPSNTLFDDDQLVAFLDFEEACEDTLLIDVAMAIHGFCFLDEEWTPHLAEAFISAYAERRPLTPAETDALPIYLRWAPLTMMGWHLRQLAWKPNRVNEERAAEFGRRVTTMKAANWSPS